jgi:hypothetical protein
MGKYSYWSIRSPLPEPRRIPRKPQRTRSSCVRRVNRRGLEMVYGCPICLKHIRKNLATIRLHIQKCLQREAALDSDFVSKEQILDTQKYEPSLTKSLQFLQQYSLLDVLLKIKIIHSLLSLDKTERQSVVKFINRHQRSEYDIQLNEYPPELYKCPALIKQPTTYIDLPLIFTKIKELMAAKQYDVACDVWMYICLGLRRR